MFAVWWPLHGDTELKLPGTNGSMLSMNIFLLLYNKVWVDAGPNPFWNVLGFCYSNMWMWKC